MSQDQKDHALRGKHLYLDCFSGVAGDMFLGAMLDLGVPETLIREGLGRLELSGYELRVGRAHRMGIAGCDVKVLVAGEAEHGHDHHHHQHRSWASIRQLLERAPLSESVRQRAISIFTRIARAESKLHGVPADEVSFHEVGAIDSIVDIVGAALALDYLSPVRVTSRVVPLGHGSTRCAHGILPVPSPAALEILADARAAVEDGGAGVELCTPTGAAIVASCVEGYGQLPAAPLCAVGYGAGDGELPDRANHLRAVLVQPEPVDPAEREAVLLEANVDDMAPEWCAYMMERLFAAGARDVWFCPIVMKKGRPALTLSVLGAPEDAHRLGTVLLSESTSIGYRFTHVGRRTLERRAVKVQTEYGEQVVKVAADGEHVLNAAPEYEVCRAAAERSGVPLKEVHAAAMAAYRGSTVTRK